MRHHLLELEVSMGLCYLSHAEESVCCSGQFIAIDHIRIYQINIQGSKQLHVEVVRSQATETSIRVDPVGWLVRYELGSEPEVNPAITHLVED